MRVLKSAVQSMKLIIVLAAVYSGATQPLYLVVPKSDAQIEQCLSRIEACANVCAANGHEIPTGCATVPCLAVAHTNCPVKSKPGQPSSPRCCSLVSTQPGVEGSRLSLDDGARGSFAIQPASPTIDTPQILCTVEDRALLPLGSLSKSPPPSRAPPLG